MIESVAACHITNGYDAIATVAVMMFLGLFAWLVLR